MEHFPNYTAFGLPQTHKLDSDNYILLFIYPCAHIYVGVLIMYFVLECV